MRPANGSAMVFQTNAAYGAESDAFAVGLGALTIGHGEVALGR